METGVGGMIIQMVLLWTIGGIAQAKALRAIGWIPHQDTPLAYFILVVLAPIVLFCAVIWSMSLMFRRLIEA